MNIMYNKNPRSITDIEVNLDGHFKYAFKALGTCIQGWQNYNPIVVVDATILTGHCGRNLFTACT